MIGRWIPRPAEWTRALAVALALMGQVCASCGGGSTEAPRAVVTAPLTPNFFLSASSASLSLTQGSTSGTIVISIASQNGFGGTVTVNLAGVPAGVSTPVTFPLIMAAGASQSVTFVAAPLAATGTFVITFLATSGALSHSSSLTLTVNSGGPFFVLEGPFPVAAFSGRGGLVHLGRLIDFDNDGDLDAVTTGTDFSNGYPPVPAVAWRNNGQGQFTEVSGSVFTTANLTTIAPRDFAVADFDRDGKPDLFIGEQGPDQLPFPGGQNRLLRSVAGGQMADETATRLPIQDAFTHCVAAADFDRDGDTDLFVSNLGNFDGRPIIGPRMYINDGTGRLLQSTAQLPPPVVQLVIAYAGCVALDVDRDGDSDLVLGASQNQNAPNDAVLLNDGAGNFQVAPGSALPARQTGPNGASINLTAADLDGDGFSDILMIQHNADFTGNRLVYLRNSGNGSFQDMTSRIPQPSAVSFAGLSFARTSDFNGDGRLDFIIEGQTGPRLLLNTASGDFTDATQFFPAGMPFVTAVLPGDLDGDGDVDALLLTPTQLFVLRNLRRLP